MVNPSEIKIKKGIIMARFIYKSLIKLAQMRLIIVVVNVNMRDHSILVQIPGDYNRFKILNDKKKEKDGNK